MFGSSWRAGLDPLHHHFTPVCRGSPTVQICGATVLKACKKYVAVERQTLKKPQKLDKFPSCPLLSPERGRPIFAGVMSINRFKAILQFQNSSIKTTQNWHSVQISNRTQKHSIIARCASQLRKQHQTSSSLDCRLSIEQETSAAVIIIIIIIIKQENNEWRIVKD